MKAPCLALALAVTLSACGGGDSTTAPPRFPSVAGTYQLDGTFNDLPANQASFDGTVSLSQPDRNVAELTGVSNVTVRIAGSTSAVTTVRSATVNEAGAVTFELPPANTSSRWAFTGSLSGTTVTGTHALTNSGSSFGGRFTMVRR